MADYPEEDRFPMNANEEHDVSKYFRNRLLQSLAAGEDAFITEFNKHEWGVHAKGYLKSNGAKEEYHSLYIYANHRAKSHFKQWIAAHPGAKIRTQPDCDIEKFLSTHNIPYGVSTKPAWVEYDFISEFYGNKKARRSGVHLINHIDEGLFIMNQFGASELAKRAFAVHPLIQGDDDLRVFWENRARYANIDKDVLLLAVEYRSIFPLFPLHICAIIKDIANGYLSFMSSRVDVKLSPIREVNDMLIADKIQNRKDFEIYHKGKHENSDRLAEYFSQWLKALGITEEKYQQITADLASRSNVLPQ